MAAQKSEDSEKRFETEKCVRIDHGEKTHPPSRLEPEHHLVSGHPAQMRRSPTARGPGGRGGSKARKPEAENEETGGGEHGFRVLRLQDSSWTTRQAGMASFGPHLFPNLLSLFRG